MSGPPEAAAPPAASPVAFASLRTPRLSDQVVEQIQAAIFARQWKPGDRLPPEKELAEQFGTSRATIREAIRGLELAGLLKTRPGAGGGPFVVEPTYQLIGNNLRSLLHMNQFDLGELFDVRLVIEPRVAELAAVHASDADLETLADNLAEEDALVRAGQEASTRHTRFHFLLARASGSNLLAILISAILDLMTTFDASHPTTIAASAHMVADHRGLLDALRAHDPERVRCLMQQHLEATRTQLAALPSLAGTDSAADATPRRGG
ncbi:MAG TPA: FadR/GntR family transcriptional regulator [Chloroflexota bacterium]|jgi:GntR family transcriptional repressor for pyruvate dehydrogenase complex